MTTTSKIILQIKIARRVYTLTESQTATGKTNYTIYKNQHAIFQSQDCVSARKFIANCY